MVSARRTALLVVLVMGVLGAACGSMAKPGNGRPAAVGSPAVLTQTDPRRVVYTAESAVRVADAVDATARATAIVRDAGGFVFAQRTDLDGRQESRLTLKVPPVRFEPVLAALDELGRPLGREVKAQDVTAEAVDLEGRLKTAMTSADRLRSLLVDARTTADLVAVESELVKRESEIESFQGKLRVLASQVDFTTIELTLTERADLSVNREVPGFLEAARAGSVALVNAGLVLTAGAGFVLPFAPFALAGAWAARRRRRHRLAAEVGQ